MCDMNDVFAQYAACIISLQVSFERDIFCKALQCTGSIFMRVLFSACWLPDARTPYQNSAVSRIYYDKDTEKTFLIS